MAGTKALFLRCSSVRRTVILRMWVGRYVGFYRRWDLSTNERVMVVAWVLCVEWVLRCHEGRQDDQ